MPIRGSQFSVTGDLPRHKRLGLIEATFRRTWRPPLMHIRGACAPWPFDARTNGKFQGAVSASNCSNNGLNSRRGPIGPFDDPAGDKRRRLAPVAFLATLPTRPLVSALAGQRDNLPILTWARARIVLARCTTFVQRWGRSLETSVIVL
jgi:hypothetical protein